MNSVKSYNFYLISLGILINLYVLNLFATIADIKVFNILVPVVLLVYFYYKNKFKINIEIKVLIIFLITIQLSGILTVLNNVSIELVTYSNLRITIILLLLIPLYSLYKKNYKLFDDLIILSIINTVLSNVCFYLFYFDYESRFRGTFGNPNEFAFLLVFMTYFILYYIDIYSINYKEHVVKKILLFILLLGVNLLILITLSRSGIILLLVFYFFYYLAIRKKLNLMSHLQIQIQPSN